MSNFGPIPVRPKTGHELFRSAAGGAEFQLRQFWRWSCSDLMSNTTRGVLAEFLVALDIGVDHSVRVEWDECDLRLRDGTRIEVKSSAYLQTWAQERLSTIRFDIAPTKGVAGAEAVASRHSDVFVFCLLECEDQELVNPMDLDQWSFLVLATRALDEAAPRQKNIGLAALRELKPVEVNFGQIAGAIRTVLES